jgi:aarF domain-containing kinase
MQASNQALGSPSNRINMMAHYAAAGLELTVPATSHTIHALGLRAFAVEKARLLLFRVVLLAIDIGFVLTQARRWVFANVFGRKAAGFEDLLQKQVQELASDYGVELDDEAFSG